VADGLQTFLRRAKRINTMTAVTRATLRWLTTSAILYMMIALIAGGIAIAENLPAEFAGFRTGLTATQDFLYGMGTALSPPLHTLIIQLAFLLMLPRRDKWGNVGVLGLTVLGLITCIGALGEPINQRVFNPATFDPVKAVIMAGMILIPVAIVVFGLKEWSRRRREI
jgi:hypothetical protein